MSVYMLCCSGHILIQICKIVDNNNNTIETHWCMSHMVIRFSENNKLTVHVTFSESNKLPVHVTFSENYKHAAYVYIAYTHVLHVYQCIVYR